MRETPKSTLQGETLTARKGTPGKSPILEGSIGFLLRRAYQRNMLIFQQHSPDAELTAVQAAALTALSDYSPCSLTELGTATAMDPATTRGVVVRLRKRRLVLTYPGVDDKREVMVRLDQEGERLAALFLPAAARISNDTLGPLTKAERVTFLRLLKKLGGDEN